MRHTGLFAGIFTTTNCSLVMLFALLSIHYAVYGFSLKDILTLPFPPLFLGQIFYSPAIVAEVFPLPAHG